MDFCAIDTPEQIPERPRCSSSYIFAGTVLPVTSKSIIWCPHFIKDVMPQCHWLHVTGGVCL